MTIWSNDPADEPPALDARWLHLGRPFLDLLGVPVTNPASTFEAFTRTESAQMEAVFQELSPEAQATCLALNPSPEDIAFAAAEKAARDKAKEAERRRNKEVIVEVGGGKDDLIAEADESDPYSDGAELEDRAPEGADEIEAAEAEVGVPIGKDGLFEVSVPDMKLQPVYWLHRGPNIPVRRGRWFFAEDRPCAEALSDELEEGYLAIKPWVESYGVELQTALTTGKSAEAKLRFELKKSKALIPGGGEFIIYQDEGVGRIISESMTSRLSATLWSALRYGGASNTGGTLVYRGYAAAYLAAHPPAGTSSRSPRASLDGARPGSSRPGSVRSGSPAPSTRSGKDGKLSSSPGGSGTRKPPLRSRKSLDELRESLGDKLRLGGEIAQNLGDVAQDLGDEMRRGVGELVGITPLETQGAPGLGPGEPAGAKASPRGVKSGEHDKVEGVDLPTQDVHGEPGEPPSEEVTDLILVVHGIGQQLASTHEGFNFVYAANDLRKEAQKQATTPALRSIMRGRQVQFLPIQWRASLKLTHSSAEAQEDIDHELHNRFTLDDITLKKSIPYVRELTNNVLIDIPYFMSEQHKQKMVDAVAIACNKTYRLWVKRHPEFEEKGRVHIIAHSLGSALVSEILSVQATTLPKMSSLPKQVIYETHDRFIFNTSHLYLVGSPLGLFLHLRQAQLIPRRGRERTKNSPPDEALDRAGRFGCLAVDSLTNIFHPSDPIAYMLNPTVDAKHARTLEPLQISNVTAGLLESFTDTIKTGVGSLSKIFDGLPNPFGTAQSAQPAKRPEVIRLPSGVELFGPVGSERLRGSQAERRFSALNPHGNIDFCLQTVGAISEYVDMVTAHGDYWQTSSFAQFILAETFATKEDLVRTGMAVQAKAAGIPR